MVAMPAAGVVNNPGCPYKVGRQCGACGVLALYHWSELGPEVAVGYLGTPVMMLVWFELCSQVIPPKDYWVPMCRGVQN